MNDDLDQIGKQVKDLAAGEYPAFLLTLADWKTFGTLTFREETPPDQARKSFYSWLGCLTNKPLACTIRN